MALIKCPECGKEVSDEANCCPNCGYVLKKAKNVNEFVELNEEKESKVHPLCLAGMIVGICSLFIDFFGLVSLVGLVISIVGITKGNQRSKKFAVTGIVCSSIEFVLKFIQLLSI